MKANNNLDFDEFLAEVGVAQRGISSNQAEFDKFINYVLRVRSFQQIFIWAKTLFRRPLHIDICLDIYPETLGAATIEV